MKSMLGQRKARMLAVIALVLAASACAAPQPTGAQDAFPADSTMAALARAGTIKIGASPNQPGLSELNLQHEWEGFNMDLAEYLVEPMGFGPDNIEWVNTTAANRIPYLQQGKIDIFATALAITPAREKILSIAGPYLQTQPQLLVRKGDATHFQTLSDIPEGAKICVLQGSQGQPRVSKSIPQAQVVEFNVLTNCIRALEQGSVDAVDSTAPLLAGYVVKQPDKFELAPATYGDGEKWGIGIAKNRPDLCEFFNERLAKAFEDGTITDLWNEHMGKSGLAAPTRPDAMSSCSAG